MQGSLREDLTKISTRSSVNILERNLAGSPLPRKFTMNRAADQEPAAQTLWECCAVEMHMDISQEQFYAIICRKNAALQDRDNLAAQTLCKLCAVEMQIPQCGHTVWGNSLCFTPRTPNWPNWPSTSPFSLSIETFIEFVEDTSKPWFGPWFSPGPVIVFKIVKNRHNGSPNFKNLQKLFALPVFGSKSALEIRFFHTKRLKWSPKWSPWCPGLMCPWPMCRLPSPRPHVHRVAYVAIGHVAAQPGKAWKTQHNSTTCWLLLVSTPHELHMYIRVYTYKHTCVVHVYIYIYTYIHHSPFTFILMHPTVEKLIIRQRSRTNWCTPF